MGLYGHGNASGARAFGGETALQSLTLPEGIEYIGSNAFNNSGLEEIVLPETLVEIGQFAFSKTRLTEVVIPGSVELLRASAFEGKSNGAARAGEGRF